MKIVHKIKKMRKSWKLSSNKSLKIMRISMLKSKMNSLR